MSMASAAYPPEEMCDEGISCGVVFAEPSFSIDDLNPLTVEKRTFYHATSAEGKASIIQDGIDLSKGRPNLDFNPKDKSGFYLTDDLGQAQEWATKRYGENGRIMEFNIPQSDLSKMNGKVFSTGNNEWNTFVTQGRNGTLLHGFDFVEGPMYKKGSSRGIGHQLAIFTQNAVDFFMKGMRR